MASQIENSARALVAAVAAGDDAQQREALKGLHEAVLCADVDHDSNKAWRLAADSTYVSDGEIEVDDDAVVSVGEEGAYVAAWVWVSGAACRHCGERLHPAAPTKAGAARSCTACADDLALAVA